MERDTGEYQKENKIMDNLIRRYNKNKITNWADGENINNQNHQHLPARHLMMMLTGDVDVDRGIWFSFT